MSYEESLRSVSFNADSSLAVYTGVPNQPGSPKPHYGNIYRFVKITGANQVGRANTAAGTAGDIVGVMQNKPQVVGEAATVAIRGISNLLSGGAIAAGDHIGADSEGRAVKAAGGANILAIAVAPATAAGQVFPALLRLI